MAAMVFIIKYLSIYPSLCGGLVACLDRRGAGVGGVGVLGDSTDSDSSGGGVQLSILGEVTPSVD